MWRGDGEWTRRDRLLALAFEIYQQSIDPDCGHSRLMSMDGDYDGHYRIKVWTCQACKASEQFADSTEGKKPRRHGEKRSIWMKLFNPNAPE